MLEPEFAGNRFTYVALGDSMSIDDYAGGPGYGSASLLFRNRDSTFPDWEGRDVVSHFPDAYFLLLARDGATSEDVHHTEIVELERSGLRPSLATITTGGNEILGSYGNTAAALEAIAELEGRLPRIIDQLRRLNDEVNIVGATVYDPSDGTSNTQQVGLPPWPGVSDLIRHVNDVLCEVYKREEVSIADIYSHFLGHGMAAGSPSQGGARPANKNLWYCGFVEANAWGAGEIRRCFFHASGLDPAHSDFWRPADV